MCNQTVNSEDRLQNSVLQLTEIKIYSFYCKAQQRLKEMWVIKQQPQEQSQKSYQTGFCTKISSDPMDQSLRRRGRICHEFNFASLKILMCQGHRTQR